MANPRRIIYRIAQKIAMRKAIAQIAHEKEQVTGKRSDVPAALDAFVVVLGGA